MLLELLVSSFLSQQAECKSAYGNTACGYACVAQYGQLKCAQTPQGACLAAYGNIVCFDPPRTPECLNAPAAMCMASYGNIACGYDCVANYGVLKCAQTPAGTCLAAYGEVRCFDPPPRLSRAAQIKAQCLAGSGKIACGFGCAAGAGDVKCAQTPRGVCTASYGTITCFEPAEYMPGWAR